jgi:hypothetical protein
MIDPIGEIYEMEFRQRDLAKELENNRRVKLALGQRNGVAGQLFRNVGHFLRQLLSRQRRPRRDASVDLKQPFLDRLG